MKYQNWLKPNLSSNKITFNNNKNEWVGCTYILQYISTTQIVFSDLLSLLLRLCTEKVRDNITVTEKTLISLCYCGKIKEVAFLSKNDRNEIQICINVRNSKNLELFVINSVNTVCLIIEKLGSKVPEYQRTDDTDNHDTLSEHLCPKLRVLNGRVF